MNLPPEIFELIISSLLPVNARGDVILHHQQELTNVRLVCRTSVKHNRLRLSH